MLKISKSVGKFTPPSQKRFYRDQHFCLNRGVEKLKLAYVIIKHFINSTKTKKLYIGRVKLTNLRKNVMFISDFVGRKAEFSMGLQLLSDHSLKM